MKSKSSKSLELYDIMIKRGYPAEFCDQITKNLIIGLFHSGKDEGIQTAEYDEDASIKVAKEVPGFDLDRKSVV